MRRVLEHCPNCGGELEITELQCNTCDTTIRSHYTPCPFCRQSDETQAFILDFLRVRGNLRELERESGESYWALRARLNQVVKGMGFEQEPQETEGIAARRREVLTRVQAGEIAAGDAAAALAAIDADVVSVEE